MMTHADFRNAGPTRKFDGSSKSRPVCSMGSMLAVGVGLIGLVMMGCHAYAQSPPPKIIRTNPVKDRVFNKNASRCDFPQTIDITFDKPINSASLTLDNFYALPQSDGCQLGQLLVGGLCTPYDPCLNASPAYSKATRTASINFVMTEGIVFVFVNGGIAHCGATQQPILGTDGQALDGDGDGKPGGTYVFSYKVVNGPRVVAPVKKKK
jgi:hypothetical protein